MKLPNQQLRAFIYNLLNEKIIVNSEIISVDSIPSKDIYSFVHIGPISLIDGPTKDENIKLCTVEIYVNRLQNDDLANWDETEEISEKVCNLLVDHIGYTTDFNIIIAAFKSTTELDELNETRRSLRNIIIIEYLIEQKT